MWLHVVPFIMPFIMPGPLSDTAICPSVCPSHRHAGCLQLSHVRTADSSADGRRSAENRTAIGGGISSRRPRGDNCFILVIVVLKYVNCCCNIAPVCTLIDLNEDCETKRLKVYAYRWLSCVCNFNMSFILYCIIGFLVFFGLMTSGLSFPVS